MQLVVDKVHIAHDKVHLVNNKVHLAHKQVAHNVKTTMRDLKNAPLSGCTL